jgi:CheY-like chemotaxis protein
MAERDKTVLVVEDDADLRELMVLLLEGAGYRVMTARDGQVALERVDERMPSVILLDMKMPGMNGWQFAEIFRARYGHAAPLIVVTAAEDARRTAEEVGADDHLGKPFELDDVLSLVERYARQGAQPRL